MIIGKQVCPCCGQTINKREIRLFRELVEALIEVYKWCETKGKYEFSRKEIKHIIKDESVTARFSDLILFGGIVYRPLGKKYGHYGINKERMVKFLAGKYKIPTSIIKDKFTKITEKSDYKFINQITGLKDYLDENKNFIVRYYGTKII